MASVLRVPCNCNRVLSVTYWLQLQSCPVCYILTTKVVACLIHTDYNGRGLSDTYWLQRSWPVCYILTTTVVACYILTTTVVACYILTTTVVACFLADHSIHNRLIFIFFNFHSWLFSAAKHGLLTVVTTITHCNKVHVSNNNVCEGNISKT